MLLRRAGPEQGIKFAWHPVDTPDGWVWLELVHYKWFGGGTHRCYQRVHYKSDPTWHDKVVDYSKCSWGEPR